MPPAPRTKGARSTGRIGTAHTVATRRSSRRHGTTTLYLVRHGVTPTTGKVMPGRAPGLHLSEAGRAQAERAALSVSALNPAPSAIYASPMERTKETAAPIARALGLRVRTHAGLLDCAVGDWEGRPLKVLARKPEWSTLVSWPTGFRFPGGESFYEMFDRVLGTVLSLVDEHRGERLVCVSHADPIKLIVGALIGAPLDVFQRITISPGSVSAVAVGEGQPTVLCMNTTGSLGELAGP